MKIILDTYAWIEYFIGSDKGKIVDGYLKEELITPFIILLELSYRADKEGWDFKKYYNFIKLKSRISGIGEEFILGFGNFYNKIKGKSPNMEIADVIILMTAVKEQAKIVTGDEHFKSMQEVIYLG